MVVRQAGNHPPATTIDHAGMRAGGWHNKILGADGTKTASGDRHRSGLGKAGIECGELSVRQNQFRSFGFGHSGLRSRSDRVWGFGPAVRQFATPLGRALRRLPAPHVPEERRNLLADEYGQQSY